MSNATETTEESDAIEIQHRMRMLRGEIREELDDVASHVKELSDWHYYVKKSPGFSLALAVATGFAVIPSRSSSSSMKPLCFSKKSGGGLGSMAFRIIVPPLLRHVVGLAATQFSEQTPKPGNSVELGRSPKMINRMPQFEVSDSFTAPGTRKKGSVPK